MKINRTADIPVTTRKAVMRRCGGRCEQCGRKVSLELHHLTYKRATFDGPEPIFGKEESADILALCRDCHEGKHRDLNGDFWSDPEEMESNWYGYFHEMDKD
ncbi:MAG: HNH endonuclease [Patescibacteria group bacterium]|nr:HNH endonuclease [Patescibacteria group bacterium]